MRDRIADAASGESPTPGALFCAALDCEMISMHS
jgi:hypothetical protein